MGIFSNLFDINSNKESMESSLQNQIIKVDQSIQSQSNFLNVHSDIIDLIWVADGNKIKSDNSVNCKVDLAELGDIEITISFNKHTEPSLIYKDLPIVLDVDISKIERPPYYPTYEELTPEQKGVYWKLLANPYNTAIDIGFVFILYYGLERHLCGEKFEQAFDVILKLRRVHSNGSFQAYSASALILCSIFKNRMDLLQKIFDSCTSNHEYILSEDLFFLCKLFLNSPLSGEEIIERHRIFGFKKSNYIKPHRNLFLNTLNEIIKQQKKHAGVYISEYINTEMLSSLEKSTEILFANVSIENRTIELPRISTCKELKEDIYELLNKTHETVKLKLAEARKAKMKLS